MSLPAISRHLKLLERARLVERAIDGRMHRCSVGIAPLRDLQLWLDDCRGVWERTVADGRVLWIVGVFEQLAPPHLLVYTWQPEQQPAFAERVTVQFGPVGDACDVSIVHKRIANADLLRGHESGWQGCLDRLVKHLS